MSVIAAPGSTLDGAASGDREVDIISAGLLLTAGTGIGRLATTSRPR